MNFIIVSLAALAIIDFCSLDSRLGENVSVPSADFADFDLPVEESIAPEENAFTYFMQASEALKRFYTDENGNSIELNKFVYENNTNLAVAAKILTENEQVFQLVRQGVECRSCVLPKPESKDALTPYVLHILSIGRLFSTKIKYEKERGDIESALRSADDLLSFGSMIRQNPNGFVSLVCAWAVEGMGIWRIQDLARDPRISKQQLWCLLEMPDKTPPHYASLQYAIKVEFALMAKYYESLPQIIKHRETFKSHFGTDSLLPYFIFRYHGFSPKLAKIESAESYRLLISDSAKFYADMTSFIEYDNIKRNFPDVFFEKNAIEKIIVSITSTTLTPLEMRCKHDANLAATKIIIASHLFQRETGRRTQTLDELVPDYLPYVPLDPFDGAPFRYNTELGVIYSVGQSLTDFGGVVESDDTVSDSNRTDPWRAKNAVFKIWEE